MELVRLTKDNADQYIGYEILFNTRGNHIVKTIKDISKTKKTVKIEHPDLNNCLEIISRKVYVLINKKKISITEVSNRYHK